MAQRAIGDDLSDRIWCPDATVKRFVEAVNANLLLSNVLMVASAVLVAVMVAVGASGRRYRHAAVTRFVFLGASTLYLPVVSYVVSSIGKEHCGTWCSGSGLDVSCHGRSYLALLLIWTVAIQIVGTNTSAIVAASDEENTKLGPMIELLARTVWTSYLVFYYSKHGFLTFPHCTLLVPGVDSPFSYYNSASLFIIVLCLLSLAKIMLKLYAFQKASQSFALGWRSSRLIEGYVQELVADGGIRHGPVPPRLIVMGEDSQEIEETPQGYTIKQRNSDLVTLDMVWELANNADTLLVSRPWLKDLCFSFALFKLLRLRFATMASLVEPATAFKCLLDVLLNSGHPKRVFKVMADEISFVLDTYYSSLPTSNFGRLLPILNIIISLSIITCCLSGCAISHRYSVHHPRQLFCIPHPSSCKIPSHYLNDDMGKRIAFGNIIYNTLPTFSLMVVVIIAEAWEITSYLCSNWIKVTMLCSYITRPSWQRSPRIQRWLGLVLQLRFKFRKSWNDRMGQMSLLPARHQQPKTRSAVLINRLLLLFSDPRIRHVQVPEVVKAAIVDALRSGDGCLSKGTAALHKSGIGVGLLWACKAQGTSDVILTWHISTGIFESRHHGAVGASSVATCLSRYCVYLMATAPELLPDDQAWSGKLYKAVGRDIERALASDEAAGHEGMVARLNERAEHEVVKRGVQLGKQLLEVAPDAEAGWALLAGFWSQMLLYVAPSDSLEPPHKKAIAGGTELLTLIWALLTHAGIANRAQIHTAF